MRIPRKNNSEARSARVLSRLCSVLLVVICLICAVADENSKLVSECPGKLVLDTYYRNKRILDRSSLFARSVEINMTLGSTSSHLLLDAEDLLVDPSSVSVLRESATRGWVQETRLSGTSAQGSLLNITFSQPVLATNYRLRLNYTGRLRAGPGGFLRVPYLYRGQTKYLAVTALGPRNARSVFPCADELSPRVAFLLDVTVDKSLAVLSNVRHSSVHNVTETTKMFHFDTYPSMPVSQLGWAVMDLSTYSQHTATAGSTVVHTRAPHAYYNHTAWACETTALLVSALGNYTQQSYPLGKLEQLVVPDLLDTVEGWGFTSYPEESLLLSPGQSSSRDSHRVLLELSRGTAGHWVQGLTSMSAWQHQWFPRALQQYLKYTAAAMIPEMSGWELQDHLVVELVQSALAMDVDNHTLATTTTNPQETVQHVYQTLSEYKGAAVIRMLQNIIGNEIFDTSVTVYFQKSANKTSEPADFWNDLYTTMIDLDMDVDLASQSVTDIMNSWLAAPGHPLLNVTGNDTHFNITQSADSQVYVPVTYLVHSSGPDVRSTWLMPDGTVAIPSDVRRTWLLPGGSVTVPRPSTSSWILVNINQTGFYRVNYDAALLALLSHQLATDHSMIPRLSRAQLIDDMFWLTFNSYVPVDLLLTFTQYLAQETDYFPWHTALRKFQNMQDRVYEKAAYQLLQSHLLRLLEAVVAKVGLVPRPLDSHTEKLRQALVLESACALEHPACVQKAVSILKSWMAATYYDPDLNMALLCAGVANSSSSVWLELRRAYDVSVYPTVRASILKALACTKNSTLLNGGTVRRPTAAVPEQTKYIALVRQTCAMAPTVVVITPSSPFLTNITSVSAPVLSPKDKTIFLKTLASTPYGAEAILDWLVETLTAQAVPASTPPPTTPLSASAPTESPGGENTTVYTSAPVAPSDSALNYTSAPVQANASSVRTKREAASPSEQLSEDEVITILSYALPKLTTLQQGTKLEGLLQQSNLNLSNETVTFLQEATVATYKKDMKAQMYNSRMTVWLSNAAACSTSSATTPGSGSTTPRRPATTAPSAAPATPSPGLAGLCAAVALALCSVVRW